MSAAKSIPTTWTESDYRWKIELPGKGHSSPVIWGDKLFVLSADPTSARRYVLCVQTDTGKIVWQKDYASDTHSLNGRNSYASSTPAVDEQRLYVAWATRDHLTLRALDHDGHEVWNLDLGPYVSEHGFGNSPIVYEDLVILVNSQQAEELDPNQQPGSSSVVAVDRETGKLRWSVPRTASRVCYPTPCIHQPQNGTARADLLRYRGRFLQSRSAHRRTKLVVLGLHDAHGGLAHHRGRPGFRQQRVGWRRQLPGGRPDGPAAARGVSPDAPSAAPYVSTPVAQDGLVYLYFDRGFVSCMQAADGEIVWSKRLTSGFSGSPVLVDGRLYCIDEGGDVLVLAASREFRELGRVSLGEPSRSTPAISGGRMFLRTESQLFCVGGD